MKNQSNRWLAVLPVALIAGGVLGAFGARLYREHLRDLASETSRVDERQPLPMASGKGANGLTGRRVDIARGAIPVEEFVRFIRDYTGTNTILDASATGRSISVSADLRDVDAEVVRALLESNGLIVAVDTLPGGRQIIEVKADPEYVAPATSSARTTSRRLGRSPRRRTGTSFRIRPSTARTTRGTTPKTRSATASGRQPYSRPASKS